MSLRLSVLSSAIALVAGAMPLFIGTNGGQAWTAESARRLAVKESPLQLPKLAINTPRGRVALWRNDPSGPSLILLELVYTRCPTVCQLMGAEFSLLQSRLMTEVEPVSVQLVSISFDPADNAQTMAEYGRRYRADDRWWTLARPVDFSQLERLQKVIGSIVIPEPSVGFVHNSAVYAIHRGEVVEILDHDDREGIDRVIDKFARGAKAGST